jgi:FtsH-binding integral membrane protein
MVTKGNRTFVFACAALVLGLVALVLGLWLCLRPSSAPVGQMVFGAFALAVTGMVATLIGALAGRSSVEALAVGGGLGGAKAALLTDSKPGGQP